MSAQAITLDTIPRAVMGAKEGYWWINALAIGLTFVIAYMSVSAYAASGTPEKALVCVICQLIAIASAIIARRAITAGMPLAASVGGAFALGCAFWASHGLALAWDRGGDAQNGYMVFFLTALEPALFLLVEHVREGRSALRNAHEAERKRSDEDRSRALRQAEAWALTAAAAPVALSAGSPLVAAQATPHAPPMRERSPIIETNTGFPDARAHALALYQAGEDNAAEIARATGVPASTARRWVGRWRKGMSA